MFFENNLFPKKTADSFQSEKVGVYVWADSFNHNASMLNFGMNLYFGDCYEMRTSTGLNKKKHEESQ